MNVLRVLALHRNPESYVAGAAPLNCDGGRFSEDIMSFMIAKIGSPPLPWMMLVVRT